MHFVYRLSYCAQYQNYKMLRYSKEIRLSVSYFDHTIFRTFKIEITTYSHNKKKRSLLPTNIIINAYKHTQRLYIPDNDKIVYDLIKQVFYIHIYDEGSTPIYLKN